MNKLMTIQKHSKLSKLVNACRVGADNSTPYQIFDEMIDNIPTRIFKNPKSKFLDPCCGVGTSLVLLYWRLRKYHTHSHVVNKMLYGIELSSLYSKLCKEKVGLKNIYNQDALKKQWNMKFDVVIGNPPYQNNHEAKRWTLWSKFVEYIKKIDSTYYALVLPNSWMGPNKEHDMIFEDAIYISLDVSKYFKEGSTFSYVVCNNKIAKSNPIIDIILNKKVYKVNRQIKFLPNDLRYLSINNKFFNSKETFNFIRTNEHHTSNKKQWFDSNGDYEIFHTHAQLFMSNVVPQKYAYEKYKAMITLSGYSKFTIKNNIGCSQCVAWMEVKNKDIRSLNSILNSKLYQTILKVNKWSGWNSLEVIKILPKVSTNKIWTDEKLYKYFKLTKEEVKLIEDF